VHKDTTDLRQGKLNMTVSCTNVIYRVGQKMAPFIVHLITLSNINRFSNVFHYQNQGTTCNWKITIDPTTYQVCRYIILWNIKRRTQAGEAIDQLRDQRWSSLPSGPQTTGLKSSQLRGLGCSSTNGLSILTIHDRQPAEAGDCHWVEQTAAAFGRPKSRYWSVVSHSWMHRPATRRTH